MFLSNKTIFKSLSFARIKAKIGGNGSEKRERERNRILSMCTYQISQNPT